MAPDKAIELVATRPGNRRAFVPLTLAAAVMAIALGAAALAGGHASAAMLVMPVASALVAVALGVWAVRSGRTSGTLRVAGGALFWDDRPLLAAGKIKEAIAFTNGRRHGVRVRSRFRTHAFYTETRDEADRIVAALGKDSSQAAVAFGSQAAALASMWGVMGQSISHIHNPAWVIALVLALVVLPFVVTRLTRVRWVVGNDGLLVRRGLGKPRFVPYADIEALEVAGAKLTVGLRDSTRLTLKSRDDSKETALPVIGAGAMKARIEEARTRAAAVTAESRDVTAELARGDRALGAWIESLSGLVDRPASYRVAAVPRERLWSALEDVTQPAEVRAAAAVALRTRLAEDEKPRLRIAASACASPRLRVALEAAEREDDAKLAEALDEVHAEGRKARA